MKVEASPRYGAAGTGWLRETLPANRSDLLVALVSRFNHDLRTPLNTIAGWAHLLQTSAADVTRVRHVSDVFARNVREQTLLLEEFVDDARALLGVLATQPGRHRRSASDLGRGRTDRAVTRHCTTSAWTRRKPPTSGCTRTSRAHSGCCTDCCWLRFAVPRRPRP